MTKFEKQLTINMQAYKKAKEVNKASETVVLISFVGAASSPSGKTSNFHGTRAPDQLQPKINKKSVLTNGTHGR